MLQGQRPRATLQCSAGSCPRATFQLNVKYVCIILCDIKLENIFSGCKMLFVYVIKSRVSAPARRVSAGSVQGHVPARRYSTGSAPRATLQYRVSAPRDASVAVRIYNNIVFFCDIKLESVCSGCKMRCVYVIKTQLNEKTVFLIKNTCFAMFSAGHAPRDASVAVRIYNNIVLLCDIKVRKHIF